MTFEQELQTYERLLPTLDQLFGKFVVIKGDKLCSISDSYEKALKSGYDLFGVDERFMVKQIMHHERVQYFRHYAL